MLINKQFDVNHFYKHGFDVVEMPKQLSTLLWAQISLEDWNPHGVYKNVPSWSMNNDMVVGSVERKYDRNKEQEMCRESLDRVPLIYKDTLTALFNEEYYRNWFVKTCGYNWEMRFIDLWNGSDSLDWHWDGVEDHDIGFLIYFTEEPTWNEEWGSVLKVGERDWPDTDVQNVKKIIPLNGTVVLLNNMNPRFVHSVDTLIDKTKNRYTINCGISLWN